MITNEKRNSKIFGPEETMSSIGEKTFLSMVLPLLRPKKEFLNGFGHDASIIDIGLSENICMTLDKVAKPASFAMGISDINVWARLCCTASFSDILTVGGEPKAFMFSIMCPPETRAKAVSDLIFETQKECQKHQVAFLGGDTKEGSDLTLVGCCIGTIRKPLSIPRNMAQPGDLLFCAGKIGGFAAANLALQHEPTYSSSIDEHNWHKHQMDYPTAKWRESSYILANTSPKSAMDNSDGFYDVYLQMTGKTNGLVINYSKIPYETYVEPIAKAFSIDKINFFFSIGDWNIFYALEPKDLSSTQLQALANNNIFCIGTFIDQPGLFVEFAEHTIEVEAGFNNHFVNRLEASKTIEASLRESVRFKPNNKKIKREVP